MFAEWELIGVPHRVVLSDRGLKENKVEYQHRTQATATEMTPAKASEYLLSHFALPH